jgi:hypothetical protein
MKEVCKRNVFLYSISPNLSLLERALSKCIFVLLPKDIQTEYLPKDISVQTKHYYYYLKWHKNIVLTLHVWVSHGLTLDKSPFSGVLILLAG